MQRNRVKLGTVDQEGKDMEELIIIGSGPAGWTAGIYAGRAQLVPLLITGSAPGGQMGLTSEIENYPGFPESISGQELTQLMQQQAERFGTRVQMDEVTAVDLSVHPFKVTAYGGEYETKALVVATGTSPKKLGAPGETEFTGRGVSYCATCDGFFFQDRRVVVVGGGDAAIEEAIFLTRFASQVYVAHRRNRLRAEKVFQERAFRNEKIESVWDSVVTEILGDGKVTGVRLRNVETEEESTLEADGVFIYVGAIPNTGFLGGQLELDDRGYIVTDRQSHTSVPGVFAAGDVQERVLKQVSTAVGSGAMAAMEAEKFIAELEDRAYPERTS
ncbi:MAG: thioredoxin-disulfide reductase [Anaerolineae bacterium]|nr:thioredoxin-disulfide reductase [Anaerolineae bacterium]